MKQLFIILAFLAVPFFFNCCTDSSKITGIKIYDYNKDFHPLAKKWKEMGINTAFVSKELGANQLFRQTMDENHISVFIIFPVFYDPESLKRDSTLYAVTAKGTLAKEDWVEFVCPSRESFRSKKVAEAADIIRTLKPDGLSIDFIREFVFWEMIYPDRVPGSIDMACFCENCVKGFTTGYNIRIPDSCLTVVQKSDYILANHQEAWNDYRTGLIASMVKEIAEKVRNERQDTKINVHFVPWRDSDFGGANIRIAAQDLSKIAPYADFISPMCYSQMLRRDDSWIASVVSEFDKKAPGKILPSIQVYPYYIDDRFTPEDFGNCVDAALKALSKGVVFFSWPLFEKDSARMNAVRSRPGR